MGRSPAFQCYAKDLYTGTSDLTAAEFGTYWRGICWSWDNGPLPLKPDTRRRVLLLDRRDFDRIWPQIRGLWKRTAKGFVNVRLETIRKEQDEYREKQAEKARKRHSRGTATAEPRQDSGSLPAHAGDMPCDLRSAPAPLDQEDQNQDQEPAPSAVTFPRAVEISKPNVPVLAALIRKERLLGEGPDADEGRKVAAARAGLCYDSGSMQRADSIARAITARIGSES